MNNIQEDLDRFTDKFKRDFEKELNRVRQEAYDEGFHAGVKNYKKPTIKQFREDHKEPRDYGEDYAMVVWASSRKKAEKLLECDPDCVVELNVAWGTYELDGEMTFGYVLNRSNDGEYEAWGCWL